MHHPLPEVPKTAPPADGKEPFLGLNVVFGINVLLNILNMALICFFPVSDVKTPMLATQFGAAIGSVISFVLDFYLWRGYNWARWVAIAAAPFAVWLLIAAPDYQSTLPQIERGMNVISYIWCIGVGLWLLLPGVARHFKSPTGNTSSEINAG